MANTNDFGQVLVGEPNFRRWLALVVEYLAEPAVFDKLGAPLVLTIWYYTRKPSLSIFFRDRSAATPEAETRFVLEYNCSHRDLDAQDEWPETEAVTACIEFREAGAKITYKASDATHIAEVPEYAEALAWVLEKGYQKVPDEEVEALAEAIRGLIDYRIGKMKK